MSKSHEKSAPILVDNTHI